MNPETGHLKRLDKEMDAEAMKKLMDEGYERLSIEFDRATKQVLKGEDSGFVSLTSGGKLSKHAAKRRKELRKIRKQSRRCNRGKR